MPIWVQPVLRSLHEALESEGLIPALDSGTVTARKAAETAGTIVKIVPKVTRVIRGNTYTAS